MLRLSPVVVTPIAPALDKQIGDGVMRHGSVADKNRQLHVSDPGVGECADETMCAVASSSGMR
jgi:hypothetical protein